MTLKHYMSSELDALWKKDTCTTYHDYFPTLVDFHCHFVFVLPWDFLNSRKRKKRKKKKWGLCAIGAHLIWKTGHEACRPKTKKKGGEGCHTGPIVLLYWKHVSATHCCVALYVRNGGVCFLLLHQVRDLVLQTWLQSTGGCNAD